MLANAVPRKRFAGEVLFFAGMKTCARMWRALVYLHCGCPDYILGDCGLDVSLFAEPVRGPAVLWREMYYRSSQCSSGGDVARDRARQVRGPQHRSTTGCHPGRRSGNCSGWARRGGWRRSQCCCSYCAQRTRFTLGQWCCTVCVLWRFAFFWGVYFVLVGIFEEFLLRGYALHTLSRGGGFGRRLSALGTFGAIHVRNPGETWLGLLAVVAIGLFFCLTLYRTGSLWFAVGFHAFWDWGQTFLYSVPDSGTMEPGHLMRPSFQGPDWLTGGSVGPRLARLFRVDCRYRSGVCSQVPRREVYASRISFWVRSFQLAIAHSAASQSQLFCLRGRPLPEATMIRLRAQSRARSVHDGRARIRGAGLSN